MVDVASETTECQATRLDKAVDAATRYWRAACVVAATHAFGLSWPPPGQLQRTRLVGHWGCNGGLAWAVGHLAARWQDAEPFIMVVGTGHATSFVTAHGLLSKGAMPEEINECVRRYGQPGGDPSEIVGDDGVPFSGGELGAALGVSQGLAAALDPPQTVVCLVGDGECETPLALAALAHADVLLANNRDHHWLPVINANGSRMGGASRFGPADLKRMLNGFGYVVHVSGEDSREASEACAAALTDVRAGGRSAWVSVSEKGWPIPAVLGQHPFRGHRAHKPSWLAPLKGAPAFALTKWTLEFMGTDLIDENGVIAGDIVSLARRAGYRLKPSNEPLRTPKTAEPACGVKRVGKDTNPRWLRPADDVDKVLARRGTQVFSPDEASSNRLYRCLAAGQVVEILAEELCAAWTWGTIEAGKEAAFVTYEAFAPLVATTLVQYSRMVHARHAMGRPGLSVFVTSLGWANTPSHQNTDLVASILVRPSPRLRLFCPVGASSAALRSEQAFARYHDGVNVVVYSKQALLDIPDPGTCMIEIKVADTREHAGSIVAIGDVCVTEAIGAMIEACRVNVPLRVLAVIDARTAHRHAPTLSRDIADSKPLIGAAWCSPDLVAPLLWRVLNRRFPVHGYSERWGSTAYETLRANRLDRVSLLAAMTHSRLDANSLHEYDLAGVPQFECPRLAVRGIGPSMS